MFLHLAQYTLPHISTPFYAVNSVYDAWQGVNILGLNANCVTHDPRACSTAEAAAFEGLRTSMLTNLTPAATAFYTYNCATHCGQFNHDERWSSLEDGEFSLRERFSRWALKGERHQSVAPVGWGPSASASCTGAIGPHEGASATSPHG